MSVDHMDWTGLPTPSHPEIDVNRHVLDGDLVAHDHDFVEVAVVEGGTAVHETLYGRREIGPGDAFVIRPGAWHTFRRCSELAVVNCCFRAHLLQHELRWLVEEPRVRLLLWPSRPADDGVVPLTLADGALRTCLDSLDRLAVPTAGAARPYRVAHLLLLLHGLASELDAAQVADAERLAATPAVVADAVALLTDDLTRSWQADELAAEVAVSPAHFSRLFHRAVGRPPMAHLAVLRAEAAATRLLRTDDPVADVGASVGWSDPNYFARRFRARFGVSPTEYRSMRRGHGDTRPQPADGVT